jgi:hypothetical protein
LGQLGFELRPKKSGTSHEDWVKKHEGRFYKVTVDCPKAPFSPDLISSMAHQAGVTKGVIYDIYFGRRTGANHGQELAPRHAENQTSASLSSDQQIVKYEVRKQVSVVSTPDEFWCVWDIQFDCEAFSGQYSYLSYSIAVEQADTLNKR